MQASRAAKLLDEELKSWRNRSIDQIEYLVVDARYEKVRASGSIRDCAVLVAIGIQPSGQRSVLVASAACWWRACRSPKPKCIGLSFFRRLNNAACTG